MHGYISRHRPGSQSLKRFWLGSKVFRLASWLEPDNTAHTSKHNQYIILRNLQFCEYTPSPLAEKNAQRNQLQNYMIQCWSIVRLYIKAAHRDVYFLIMIILNL